MIVGELFENREAYLYHATGLGNAIQIVDHNEFEARTQHYINGKNYSGVSCTRSPFMAKAYSNIVFGPGQEQACPSLQNTAMGLLGP